ncbi:class I adenylate-forming enzyme family protein [Streptomyces sp. NPDC047017]|uniref:class I adenylate-forming enzyme family protein n=1 Tax=Streptomyces sp. NPDC047017 TaxID=3155024 RepID=UPI00340BB4E7
MQSRRPWKGDAGMYYGTLVEHAARLHPDTPVHLDETPRLAEGAGPVLTLAETAGVVQRLSARLWAAGVRPAERVAVHLRTGFDYALTVFAAARIGAVPVPIASEVGPDATAELLARLRRPHLVTDAATLTGPLAAVPLDDLAATVLLVDDGADGGTPLAAFAGAAPVAPVRLHPDQPALMTHTSGTTGVPKIAVQTARTLQWRYRVIAAMAPLVAGRRETSAMHLSFAHAHLYAALAVAMRRGMPLVVLADPDPEAAADLFARTRPTMVDTHPNTFLQWEGMADDPRRPLAGVRYFTSTFDAIHPRTVRRLLNASERRNPLWGQVYGQSETGPVALRVYTRRGADHADGRCVGHPVPGVTRVRTRTADRRPAGLDDPGCIDVTSRGRAVTYFGEPERYAAELLGDWWRMGDLGYRTRYGCLHLLDRQVDRLPAMRSNLEAEDLVLERLPELVEAVIVAGGDGQPVPVVATRGDAPLSAERWEKAVADLPPMDPPVRWAWADLPRTATSKIKRLELSRLLAAGPQTSPPAP